MVGEDLKLIVEAVGHEAFRLPESFDAPDIRVRMAAIDESVWPLPSVTKKLSADPSKRVGFSDFVKGGRVVFEEVIKAYYEQTNKEFGTNYQPPK